MGEWARAGEWMGQWVDGWMYRWMGGWVGKCKVKT